MNVTTGSNQVFSDLVSLATIFGLFNWISIMVTYLSFRRGMEAQNMPRASLPYTESWMKLRVSGSLFITCLVVLFNGMLRFSCSPFFIGSNVHSNIYSSPRRKQFYTVVSVEAIRFRLRRNTYSYCPHIGSKTPLSILSRAASIDGPFHR